MDQVTNVAQLFPGRNRSDSRYYVIDFYLFEIRQLKVSERFFHNNMSLTYPLRFPAWKSSFEIHTFEEELELIEGMQKSFENIYKLDKNGRLTGGKVRKAGIYPEVKQPAFHLSEGRGNQSEIFLSVMAKYGYTNKRDDVMVNCFNAKELKRIRNELKSNLTLIQLMPAEYDPDFEWNNISALRELKNFVDGISVYYPLLLSIDANTKTIKPNEFYYEAKRLGLLIHAWTFRIDDMLPFVSDYESLLNIYVNELKVDAVITDFPDLTLEYLKSDSPSSIYLYYPKFFAAFLFSFVVLMYS